MLESVFGTWLLGLHEREICERHSQNDPAKSSSLHSHLFMGVNFLLRRKRGGIHCGRTPPSISRLVDV